jgi:hypothetical protein
LGDEHSDFLGIEEKGRSLEGEGDAIAGAIEETDAEIVFECLDLLAYRRLGDKKFFSCTAYAVGLRDLFEVGKLIEIHTFSYRYDKYNVF